MGKWSKRLGSSLAVTGLSLGLVSTSLFTGSLDVKAKTAMQETVSNHHSNSHSALDLAIVNDDKLIDSLIKKGVISKNASQRKSKGAAILS